MIMFMNTIDWLGLFRLRVSFSFSLHFGDRKPVAIYGTTSIQPNRITRTTFSTVVFHSGYVGS